MSRRLITKMMSTFVLLDYIIFFGHRGLHYLAIHIIPDNASLFGKGQPSSTATIFSSNASVSIEDVLSSQYWLELIHSITCRLTAQY